MIGYHDICSVADDLVSSAYFQAPCGNDPGIKRCPEAGELLKDFEPGIKPHGKKFYGQGHKEKEYRSNGYESKPGDDDKTVNHVSGTLELCYIYHIILYYDHF
jgi:hypothetical protein